MDAAEENPYAPPGKVQDIEPTASARSSRVVIALGWTLFWGIVMSIVTRSDLYFPASIFSGMGPAQIFLGLGLYVLIPAVICARTIYRVPWAKPYLSVLAITVPGWAVYSLGIRLQMNSDFSVEDRWLLAGAAALSIVIGIVAVFSVAKLRSTSESPEA